MTDYYDVLGITRAEGAAGVRVAYRKLALEWHPAKNSDRLEEANEKFALLAEAYTVLSDVERRGIFDRFGEDGLKGGVPAADGGTLGGWTFGESAMEVFVRVFGTDNPFHVLADDALANLNSNLGPTGGLSAPAEPKQPAAAVRDLECSLEELYAGATKKIAHTKRVLNSDGQTTRLVEKMLTIHLRKGWKEGTKITFAKEGDEGPGIVPADVVYVLKTKTHARFVRKGADLLYTARIPLVQALTGCVVKVRTLDDRVLSVPVHEVVHPDFCKVVPGEGMPKTKGKGLGDLRIGFVIEFPERLSEAQKTQVKAIF